MLGPKRDSFDGGGWTSVDIRLSCRTGAWRSLGLNAPRSYLAEAPGLLAGDRSYATIPMPPSKAIDASRAAASKIARASARC